LQKNVVTWIADCFPLKLLTSQNIKKEQSH
jgi:hypothetical protein